MSKRWWKKNRNSRSHFGGKGAPQKRGREKSHFWKLHLFHILSPSSSFPHSWSDEDLSTLSLSFPRKGGGITFERHGGGGGEGGGGGGTGGGGKCWIIMSLWRMESLHVACCKGGEKEEEEVPERWWIFSGKTKEEKASSFSQPPPPPKLLKLPFLKRDASKRWVMGEPISLLVPYTYYFFYTVSCCT